MGDGTGLVDLRSDTVTRPTDEMRAAMADAEVGDDVYGEDPTVNRLQSLAAALLGKEAALYVPSGTMANQLAIRVLARPGTEVLVPERSHVYRYEAAAAPLNSGVQLHPLPDPEGIVTAEQYDAACEGSAHHLAPVSLVWIENTHMPAHGRPLTVAEVGAVVGVARARAAGALRRCAHLERGDRARRRAVGARRRLRHRDVLPLEGARRAGRIGALRERGVIAEARVHRQRFGGGMRQAGVIAAAGIVALETMVERLADDHAAPAGSPTRSPSGSPTRSIPRPCAPTSSAARSPPCRSDTLERLADAGILAGTLDPSTFRFVVHKDVDDDGIDRACRAIRQL